ncbi:DNA ligase D [Allocatelliglobosispora scoriae]|uniref:DNA ligase D n=1 Tax=Allocatelliglobosispora scoriae TaxID=643052 RepID=A0A841BY44_9ACTN|nr:non-homologous end-joining DNA ligase [Allocatelliglobosispora scoriae]MBB5872466.1 DNA ligase D [Allocatelliglobosispora scoriae]
MATSKGETFDVGNRSVRLSSPDKVYFPQAGYTKRDVFEYYLAVMEPMLRAMRDRPTMLQRFPDGLDGETFYQKRAPVKGIPDWLATTKIMFPSGRTAEALCVREGAHIAWAAQMGAIVFHPWPVRADDTDKPDELRVDLDPQPGTDFADAARVAGLAREVLAEAGLTGYPKTSGGRGVHIYVRIRPEWSFVDARHAVIAFARALERRDPDRITTSWWKEERGEKVFIDYNQMARDRTIAGAYSLRANQRATVSTPVTWDELTQVEPDDFDLRTVPARLATVGDPFATMDDDPHDLTTLLEWYERDQRDHDLGDLPYPPEYPKMPGEPMRVQPSKARNPE